MGPSQGTQATYDKLYLKTQEPKNYSAFKALLVVINIRLMSTSIRKQNIEYSFWVYQYLLNCFPEICTYIKLHKNVTISLPIYTYFTWDFIWDYM